MAMVSASYRWTAYWPIFFVANAGDRVNPTITHEKATVQKLRSLQRVAACTQIRAMPSLLQ